MLAIGNAVVMIFIFLRHNGLSGRSKDSNYFYTEKSIPCTNFCVQVTPFACTLRARTICEAQFWRILDIVLLILNARN